MQRIWNLALLILLVLPVSGHAFCLRAQPLPGEQVPAELRTRLADFLAGVRTRPPRQLALFFPRVGEVTYRHTVYADTGARVTERVFSASEIPAALDDSLWPVHTFQQEGQVIGLFAHQVSLRRGEWRHVGDYRFVPPGADRCSAIYVQWRLENGAWVIAAIADEDFKTGALPRWCC